MSGGFQSVLEIPEKSFQAGLRLRAVTERAYFRVLSGAEIPELIVAVKTIGPGRGLGNGHVL
jgi:hypothetical protein